MASGPADKGWSPLLVLLLWRPLLTQQVATRGPQVENTHPVSQTNTSGVEKSLVHENIHFRMADNNKAKTGTTAKANELNTDDGGQRQQIVTC